MEIPVIKQTITYGKFKGGGWSGLKQKLANTPTTQVRASHIRKLIKALDQGEEAIKKDYEETVLKKHARLNEDGTLWHPPGDPAGYEFLEESKEQMPQIHEDFGKREVSIEMQWRPLTPDTLADFKMTAAEMDLLGDFFSEESGPGLPPLQMQR